MVFAAGFGLFALGIAGGVVALSALAALALWRGRKAIAGYGIPYGVAIAAGGLTIAHRLVMS
ncbi:MAG: hypothetical protein EXQ96_00335 [Alphaproteobacteria bacterium]|nr:hypothetical protein [Alphaproteobacteria bacterium]